jgi:hypothetical protein
MCLLSNGILCFLTNRPVIKNVPSYVRTTQYIILNKTSVDQLNKIIIIPYIKYV